MQIPLLLGSRKTKVAEKGGCMAPCVLCPRMVVAVPNVYEVLLKLLDETRPQ